MIRVATAICMPEQQQKYQQQKQIMARPIGGACNSSHAVWQAYRQADKKQLGFCCSHDKCAPTLLIYDRSN